jgi:hypothetical protein
MEVGRRPLVEHAGVEGDAGIGRLVPGLDLGQGVRGGEGLAHEGHPQALGRQAREEVRDEGGVEAAEQVRPRQRALGRVQLHGRRDGRHIRRGRLLVLEGKVHCVELAALFVDPRLDALLAHQPQVLEQRLANVEDVLWWGGAGMCTCVDGHHTCAAGYRCAHQWHCIPSPCSVRSTETRKDPNPDALLPPPALSPVAHSAGMASHHQAGLRGDDKPRVRIPLALSSDRRLPGPS